MKKKEVINFENLGIYITKIEKIFEEEDVNTVEQNLILSECMNRLQAKQKNSQVRDMITNVPLGGLIKNILKSRKSVDEEKE